MKVAHLIMVHKEPAQLERLIQTLSYPDFHFYIHLDGKAEMNEFAQISNLKGVKFIDNRVTCNWGGFSFVDAILTSLEEILGNGTQYDFINLMSGQDYPTKSSNDFYNFLLFNRNKCFISFDTDPHRKWWKKALKRTEQYHLTDRQFKGRYWVQKLLNTFLPKRVFPISHQFYGGRNSSWWTITSSCAAYVVNFIKDDHKLKDFMKYTWGSDEFLITSIIMNSKYAEQAVNNNLRLITWSDGHARPHILTIKDLPLILEANEKFFARKFDCHIDEAVLDQIDLNIKHNF